MPSSLVRAAIAVTAAFTLGLSACGGGDDGPAVALDGSPRVPDAEGVVTEVTDDEIVLDGKRTFDVADDLMAFSTYTLEAVPLAQRKGQYVQVGLDGETVEWLALIGEPLEGRVYYTGEIDEINGEQIVFADGTVLTLGSGV
ncbi:MAG: hypothetical protein ACLGHT_00705, partial [Acidimicrobiia bacterium]